jgi:hypothetical protein
MLVLRRVLQIQIDSGKGAMAKTVLHRNDAVIWDVVNGSTTLCHTDRAEFFTVNHTGAAIWELCEGRTVDELIAEIGSRYPEADGKSISTLVEDYLGHLEKEGLLERKGRR